MSVGSISNTQFTHENPSLGAISDVSPSNSTGDSRPKYQGPTSVVPHRADTNSTFGRATAWTVPRSGFGLPQPYSKRNAGSVFNFNE